MLIKKTSRLTNQTGSVHTKRNPLICQNRNILQELAPFKRVGLMVAGLHRASPSTSLDKRLRIIIQLLIWFTL